MRCGVDVNFCGIPVENYKIASFDSQILIFDGY